MANQTVIGLEIHVQAKTKSKMFSREPADYFGDAGNSHVDPVSLGLPGALPVPNMEAVDQTLRIALALNCQINKYTKFDRKNYFYPDLSKGYQITQYDFPIGYNGSLEIESEAGKRIIRIRRIHLEEDTGKSIHGEGEAAGKDITLLDYNKAGIPLIEIVTEPDFQSIAEVTAFAKLLKQTVEYTGVSDAEMQKGQMRFELNISLRTPADGDNLPNYRVEVKNIGSISVLEKVIENEVARQAAELAAGSKLSNETRGLKDMSGATVSQRIKETEDDYRYFPEPDIPPFTIGEDHIAELKAALPELPAARRQRYISDFGLDTQAAEILVEQSDKGDWIDEIAKELDNPELTRQVVKWLLSEVSGYLEKGNIDLGDSPVTRQDLIYIVTNIADGKISGSIAKRVVETMFAAGGTAEEIVNKEGLAQVNDDSQLRTWVEAAIANNQKVIESLSKNPNAVMALVGYIMRESKGQANPKVVEKMLRENLGV